MALRGNEDFQDFQGHQATQGSRVLLAPKDKRVLLLKEKTENSMEEVTPGCQDLQDPRVCQAPQVFQDLWAHLALQDSLAFQELQDL